jgi:hypothetical protein
MKAAFSNIQLSTFFNKDDLDKNENIEEDDII